MLERKSSPVMYHNYEITGIGFHAGSKPVSTKSLVEKYQWERSLNGGPKKLLTVDEVEKTSGIKERRFADHGETVTSLAVAASRQALGIEQLTSEEASIVLQRVKLIAVNTSSPKKSLPGIGPEIAKDLGTINAEPFDFRQACAAVPFLLKMVIPAVSSGIYEDKDALAISSDTLSEVTDYSNYITGSLLSDAAGAFRLKRSGTKRLAYFELTSAGELAELLEIPPGQKYIHMNGLALYEEMLKRVPVAVESFFDHTGLSMKDINFTALHPGSGKLQKALIKKLHIPEDKTLSMLEKYGNPSAALTIGAIKEASDKGRINEGDKILIAGFGSGVLIGVGVIEWSMPNPHNPRRKLFHLINFLPKIQQHPRPA